MLKLAGDVLHDSRVTKLRLKPPSQNLPRFPRESSLLGGRSAAAKTAFKVRPAGLRTLRASRDALAAMWTHQWSRGRRTRGIGTHRRPERVNDRHAAARPVRRA